TYLGWHALAPHACAVQAGLNRVVPSIVVGASSFFCAPVFKVAADHADLHSKSKNALLIGADLERGAGQQFAGETALPPLAAIASLEDLQTVRRAAGVTAREARELGINWIYAPDCDLDIEPDNPIVGTRSFG